jgi:hypothetical protein
MRKLFGWFRWLCEVANYQFQARNNKM